MILNKNYRDLLSFLLDFENFRLNFSNFFGFIRVIHAFSKINWINGKNIFVNIKSAEILLQGLNSLINALFQLFSQFP
jgi:hypothetical protein